MLFSSITTLFALFAVGHSSFASDCNPLETTCPADPALGGSMTFDFKSESPYFSPLASAANIKYTDSGLVEWFSNHGDAPSLRSNFYILYGTIEVVCKSAPGTGIISNVFLQSDSSDEIDFEWIGSFPNNAYTNYFGKGVAGNYDRGITQDTGTDLTDSYHTYIIDWQKDKTVWYVDGKVVRTLLASECTKGGDYDYPVSPMKLFVGLWAGGDSASEGTVEWAGGKTTTDGAPFIFNVKSLTVTDASHGTSYSYGDTSGDNIIINGDSAGNALSLAGASGSVSNSTSYNSTISLPSDTAAPTYQIASIQTVAPSATLDAGIPVDSSLTALVTGTTTWCPESAAAGSSPESITGAAPESTLSTSAPLESDSPSVSVINFNGTSGSPHPVEVNYNSGSTRFIANYFLLLCGFALVL